MYFKSYKNIETAIQQYRNDCYLRSEVKIRSSKNVSKDERRLIDAAILCKVLITFGEYYDEFSKNYNMRHLGHLFWNDSTFQLKYSASNYTFELHSSDFYGHSGGIHLDFEDVDKCTKRNIDNYTMCINSFIDQMLKELREYALYGRYNSIIKHISLICNAE